LGRSVRKGAAVFYRMKLGVKGMSSWLVRSKTRDEAFRQFTCPVMNQEVTLWDGCRPGISDNERR